MYYITNQNGQIIAASADLLAMLQVDSVDALYRQVALNAIEFDMEQNDLTLKTPLEETRYVVQKETLSSILGEMTLVRLAEEISGTEVSEALIPALEPEEEDDILFEMKEEPEEEEDEAEVPLFETLDEPLIKEDLSEKEEQEEEEEALFGIKEASEETAEIPLAEMPTTEEEDLFDLTLPSSTEETIEKIEDKEAEKRATGPVYIDIEKISENIGISTDDYNTFLTEYIDTALSLEDDLRSTDKGKRTAAIHTLFHLSNVLQLPLITEIIEQLKYTEEEDIENAIQSFYDTLSRLTTTKPKTEDEETQTLAKEREEEPETYESFGTIDLSDVKPIHFDFQVEAAANELSLPAELIEEFIHDFIKQAREETDKMLKAYERGDLETIQKIGHLLKGTASNLRINKLADTLYEIQFCEDSSKLEKLIKDYWAHFLSFETQFQLTSHTKGN